MIDLDLASNGNERIALEALAAMETGTFGEFMESRCTEDFVWANSGLPTLNGIAEIREHMAGGGFAQFIPSIETMRSFSVDMIHIASAGNVVFTDNFCCLRLHHEMQAFLFQRRFQHRRCRLVELTLHQRIE